MTFDYREMVTGRREFIDAETNPEVIVIGTWQYYGNPLRTECERLYVVNWRAKRPTEASPPILILFVYSPENDQWYGNQDIPGIDTYRPLTPNIEWRTHPEIRELANNGLQGLVRKMVRS